MSQRTDWLNRLGKWWALLTGWQLGTRPKGDPEGDAVRDHREATLMMRAELNAIAQLLIDKGLTTREDFAERLQSEAKYCCETYEERFPGARAEGDGMSFDARAAEWMRSWKP